MKKNIFTLVAIMFSFSFLLNSMEKPSENFGKNKRKFEPKSVTYQDKKSKKDEEITEEENSSDALSSNERSLLRAARIGDRKTIKELIELGINLEPKDRDGRTPLILASMWKHVKVVKLLLNGGANVNATDNNKDSALIRAAMCANLKILKLLLAKNVDLEIKNMDDDTALGQAIFQSENWYEDLNSEVVKLLLDQGAKVNNQDFIEFIKACCSYTTLKANLEIVELLVNHVDVNTKDKNGNTVLMLALDARIIKMLLKAGAKIDDTDNFGKTALMLRAYYGEKKLAKTLIDAGANIDATDEFNSTALMIAIIHDLEEIAQMLLDAGANIYIKDYFENTAYDYAIACKNERIAERIFYIYISSHN